MLRILLGILILAAVLMPFMAGEGLSYEYQNDFAAYGAPAPGSIAPQLSNEQANAGGAVLGLMLAALLLGWPLKIMFTRNEYTDDNGRGKMAALGLLVLLAALLLAAKGAP